MHSKSNNIKFTDANEVELFDSLRSRYQENLEKSIKKSGLFLIQFS